METGFIKITAYFFGAQILALIDNLVKSNIVEDSDINLVTPFNPLYYVKYPLAIVSVVLGFLQFVLLLKGFDEGSKLTGNESIASISYAAFLFVFSIFIGINYLAFAVVRKEIITAREWILIFGIFCLQLLSALIAWLLGTGISKNKAI